MSTGKIWAGQEWAAFEMRLETAEAVCELADATLGQVTLGLKICELKEDDDGVLKPVLYGAAAMLDEAVKTWRYELEHPRKVHPIPGYSLVRCNKNPEPHMFDVNDCEDALLITRRKPYDQEESEVL